MSRKAQRKSGTRSHQLGSFHLLRSRRRKTEKLNDFGRALAEVSGAKRPTLEVLADFMAGDEIGAFWLEDFEKLITRGRVSDGSFADEPLRSPDSPVARALARFGLKQLAKLKRFKVAGQDLLAFTGKDAFWGKQHVELERESAVTPDDEWDLAELEREAALEASGVAPKPKRKRKHVPAAQAGGLAAEHECSPRTIGRWAVLYRRLNLFGSHQPPAHAEDAVKPKRGKWAYSRWAALRELPQRLMHALQALWGERLSKAPPAPPKPKAPRPAPVRDVERATGPPPALPPIDWSLGLKGPDLIRAIRNAHAQA